MSFIIKQKIVFVLTLSVWVKADIVAHVQTLDYAVCDQVQHPKAGEEDQLSSNLLQLFMALDEIHDMLRDEREAGKTIVQQIFDGGGLQLSSIKPNFPFIMKTFNWTIDESKVLGVTIKDTVKMWQNIKIGMDIIPTTEIDYALNPEKDRK